MVSTSALAETAAALGEPARVAMLGALMDGRALTAGELAAVAGVAPTTASGHLSRLLEAGLLAVERQGRHRYHRLASPEVARVLEGLMALSAARPAPRRALRTGPRDAALREARTCYDHLAGRLAVGMADAMVARGQIQLSPDGGALTDAGADFLQGLGVPVPVARGRPFCRPCLDWSERRPHLAGALGAALCLRCLDLGWMRRVPASRALDVTPAGRLGLRQAFGLDRADQSSTISAAR
ncbi:ArsR/SmtB family transcription factor [Pararoseomonas indoligenes]|uniref:Helix-turn-helix transcriptional regulator n=1 Tax=Roseomonas indoligenes TaxID=2820811 RepID=A0A940S532_9PROT|nr:helix-turn-helix transcriptional regulator [Pararoseomonas indoligenes]MBP0492599.1 helix-turn-helix transcriptional regulator [Pararoseomonas indoligenes]